MRKSILFAALALFSATLYAQRGGHGGGGHAGGFSGGHASSGNFGGARSAGRVSPSYRSFSSTPRATGYRQPVSSYGAHSGVYGYNRTDRRRRVGYSVGYPYGYPGYGYSGWGYGYPGYLNGGLNLDDNDPNDPNLQNSYISSGYGDPGGSDPAEDQQAYAGPYLDPPRPPYNPGGVAQDPGSRDESKVALVFKDGSRLEIKNYVATRTRILVRDQGASRDILVSALDIPATMAANQAAGVDFSLPGD